MWCATTLKLNDIPTIEINKEKEIAVDVKTAKGGWVNSFCHISLAI